MSFDLRGLIYKPWAFLIGIPPILQSVVEIFLYYKTKDIIKLIDSGDYSKARSKILTWMIVSFLLVVIVVGILLFVVYIMLGEVNKP